MSYVSNGVSRYREILEMPGFVLQQGWKMETSVTQYGSPHGF
jgi:hypothetical protein